MQLRKLMRIVHPQNVSHSKNVWLENDIPRERTDVPRETI